MNKRSTIVYKGNTLAVGSYIPTQMLQSPRIPHPQGLESPLPGPGCHIPLPTPGNAISSPCKPHKTRFSRSLLLILPAAHSISRSAYSFPLSPYGRPTGEIGGLPAGPMEEKGAYQSPRKGVYSGTTTREHQAKGLFQVRHQPEANPNGAVPEVEVSRLSGSILREGGQIAHG